VEPAGVRRDWQERGSGRRKSSHTERAKRLFVDPRDGGRADAGVHAARQTAEQYATDKRERPPRAGERALAGKVGAYQAALNDDRRREIEADPFRRPPGVWSTSALELGVDVGA